MGQMDKEPVLPISHIVCNNQNNIRGNYDYLVNLHFVRLVPFAGDRWDKPALNYTHTSTNLNKATTMYKH